MEIPMSDVINSYRQQLSDAVHQLTLRDLHIKNLEKSLDKKRETITDLQMKLDFYELAKENVNDYPEEWEEPDGNDDSGD